MRQEGAGSAPAACGAPIRGLDLVRGAHAGRRGRGRASAAEQLSTRRVERSQRGRSAAAARPLQRLRILTVVLHTRACMRGASYLLKASLPAVCICTSKACSRAMYSTLAASHLVALSQRLSRVRMSAIQGVSGASQGAAPRVTGSWLRLGAIRRGPVARLGGASSSVPLPASALGSLPCWLPLLRAASPLRAHRGSHQRLQC